MIVSFKKTGDDSYEVLNAAAKYLIGRIIYYPLWLEHVFVSNTVEGYYTPEMLTEIAEFMKELEK